MRFEQYITEEWMNTYQYSLVPGLSNDVDVFVNPSRKDFRDTQVGYAKSSRFILDNKKKKCYIWNANEALHRDMWIGIAKETNDNRRVYLSDELLLGQVNDKGNVVFESNFLYSLPVWERIYYADWKWSNKYIKNLTSTLEKEKSNE